MSRETTDTRGSNYIEPGIHVKLTVDHVEKGKTLTGHPYYTFHFYTPTGKKWDKRFMVWLCPPILKALGCKETKPGIFDWDTAEVEGRAIEADTVYEKVKGKEYTTIINIEPSTADREIGDEPDEFDEGIEDVPA